MEHILNFHLSLTVLDTSQKGLKQPLRETLNQTFTGWLDGVHVIYFLLQNWSFYAKQTPNFL
jgi:hypothetical protein